MGTKISKENFILLLEKAIPDNHRLKPQLLQYADRLVQTFTLSYAYEELNDPVVLRATRLYMRSHPSKANVPPSLPELIRWLRGRRGLDYTAQLEKRLTKLRKHLDRFGSVSIGEIIQVPADTIIAMRMVAGEPDKNAESE